jgi:hypothetical protein
LVTIIANLVEASTWIISTLLGVLHVRLKSLLVDIKESKRLRIRPKAIVLSSFDRRLEIFEYFHVICTKFSQLLLVKRLCLLILLLLNVRAVLHGTQVAIVVRRTRVCKIVWLVAAVGNIVVRTTTRGRRNREGRRHVSACWFFTGRWYQKLRVRVLCQRGDRTFTVLLVGSSFLLPILT